MKLIFSALLSVILRVLPHIPNFTPLGASAAWAGRSHSLAFAMVYSLALYALGNACMTYYSGMMFWFPGAAYVYAGIALYAVSGYLLKGSRFGLTGAAFVGSCMFFAVSNFGVWMSGMYSHNLQGLLQCYTQALPFFSHTLMGDLTWALCFMAIDEALPLLRAYHKQRLAAGSAQ